MSLALVRKELHEHGVIVAVALALGALAHLGLLRQADDHGGRFVAFTQYHRSIGTLFALVLANRLFVREYAGRTQLFLESLPIARARVFATKWLLGFGVLAATTAASWLATLLWARRSEVLPWDDALRTLLCGMLFALAAWSWSAMAGMLGRYRYVAWLALVLLFFVADTVAGIELGELPVLRLLEQDVAMARGLPSWLELSQALAVCLASSLAAAALALLGSGAMASALAHRMTARERVFVWVSFIAALVIASTLEREVVKPPFELKHAERVRGRADVAVMPTTDLTRAQARELALRVAADVRALRTALAIDALPHVSIIAQQGLDRSVIERASLDEADGIVLRAAPDAPRVALRSEVLHSVLADASLGRATHEDRHVFLDGFSTYLALDGDAAGQELQWLRAATAPAPLRSALLTRWDESSERLGTCLAAAVAFAAVDTLARQLGRAQLFALMRQLFRRPPDDVRVLFEQSPAARLERAGTSWASLAARTEAALAAARSRHAATLARRPRLQAKLTTSSSASTGRKLEAELVGTPSYWVRYALLEPWARQSTAHSRFDARTPRVVVPLSPARGARVFAAIEVDDPVLDCEVRVLARRMRFR